MVPEEVDLALLLGEGLGLVQRAGAGLAGGRRGARAGAGREGAGPSASGVDQLGVAAGSGAGPDATVVPAVARRPCRDGEAGSGVLAVPALLLLDLVLVGAPVAGEVADARRHPVEVLLEVAAAAPAAARLERQVVALLRPEILVALTLGPAAGPSAVLQISQHGLFPGVETLPVHELPVRAVVVVARDLDRVLKGVHPDGHVAAKTLARRRAAPRRAELLSVQRKVVEGLVVVRRCDLQEAGYVAVGGVSSRCHRCFAFYPALDSPAILALVDGLDPRRCLTSEGRPLRHGGHDVRLRLFLEDEPSEVREYLGRQVVLADFRQRDDLSPAYAVTTTPTTRLLGYHPRTALPVTCFRPRSYQLPFNGQTFFRHTLAIFILFKKIIIIVILRSLRLVERRFCLSANFRQYGCRDVDESDNVLILFPFFFGK